MFYLLYKDLDTNEWSLWGCGSSPNDYKKVKEDFSRDGIPYKVIAGEVVEENWNSPLNNLDDEDMDEFDDTYYANQVDEDDYYYGDEFDDEYDESRW